MERVFEISPKTTNEWLRSQNMTYGEVKLQVSKDIIKNGQELEDRVDWRVVMDTMTCTQDGKKFNGLYAVYHSMSRTIGSIVQNMGWDMHSPEVVYMSGSQFAWSLGTEAGKSSIKVSEIESGKAVYIDSEAQGQALRFHESRLGKFGTFAARFQESIREYAAQTLPNDPNCLAILRRLNYLHRVGVSNSMMHNLYDLMKNGNYEQALILVKR